MTNVVPLRMTPDLTDVPGQLRQLADAIERGEHGEIQSATFVLTNDRDDWPLVFGWGQTDVAQSTMELDLARLFLLQTVTRRG